MDRAEVEKNVEQRRKWERDEVPEPLLSVMPRINLIARAVLSVTVEEAQAVLDEIEGASAFMPFFDPTAYMKIAPNIPGHREAVRAFLDYRLALERILKREGVDVDAILRAAAGEGG